MKFPAFSSVITKELGQRHNVPPNVMVPEISASARDYFRSHFLGAQYDPLQIPDPNRQDYNIPELSLPESLTLERIEARNAFLELVDGRYRQAVESTEYANLDEFRQQALNMVLSQSVRQAFDLSREPEKLKDAYGRNMFGQSVLIARRLVEAGSRFVTAYDRKRVETGRNWDTHGTNDKQHKDVLVPVLDQTLSTLLTDLEERGLLESTLVIAMGEFGRTYDLNPGGGRDHWCHCWSMVLGGRGHPWRADHRRQRRKGSLCGGPHGDHRRSPGHHLQGPGHRLDPGVHAPHWPSPQDRQLHQRRNRKAD